jgi:aconitate hydratase
LTVPFDVYDAIDQDTEIEFPGLAKEIRESSEITFMDIKKSRTYEAEHNLTARQRGIILAGGLLNYVRAK